jgi:dinuclear metal center YbgI/SA1388 family protein
MTTVKIKDVIGYLESWAPRNLQEEYDNSGLLTGNQEEEVTGILVTLDCTEQILDEALAQKCNMVVAHHPILFRGLKKLTGQNYVERTIIKAIRSGIAIYAIHTNLDNVLTGVNFKIAARLGLKNISILQPKKHTLTKLVTFIPPENAEEVIAKLHEAGAGNIGNYKNCSFRLTGQGTYLPTGEANPYQGSIGKLERSEEVRVELILPTHLESRVLAVLKKVHPYEEVAYYLSRLENENQEVGSGIVGELEHAEPADEFLKGLKEKMNTACVRHTQIIEKEIKKIAVCGGSGSFLLSTAIAKGADIFITADFKYHEFFDADGKIVVADIGHYESEQFTKELIYEYLKEKFHTFAIIFSKTVTNPISYL